MSDQPPPLDYNPGDKYPAPYNGPPPSPEDKTMGMLCHLLAIFTGFLGPLVLWIVKKEQSPYVDDQGKEALNFQITCIIATLCCLPLFAVCVGIPLFILVQLARLVLTIMATIQTNNGIAYRYPVSLRLIK